MIGTGSLYAEHDAGWDHRERPERLAAVLEGVRRTGLDTVAIDGHRAGRADLERVHDPAMLDHIEALSAAGGGRIDGDTVASARTWDAAVAAAGAGLHAAGQLRAGAYDAAFLAVRPPGHHATRGEAMGFCFVNSVAVVAAALAAEGERVLVLDWDAHHGNGTQDIFWSDPQVLFVSLHQWPCYPGTGRPSERGDGEGTGTTLNVTMPAGATGDVYRAAFDELIDPQVSAFGPTWVLISAGFDAHRSDPLTGLGLSSGDFVDLTERVMAYAPGRVIAMLEGGYDLEALRDCTEATVSTLAGAGVRPEPPTSGGPGLDLVAAQRRDQHG